MRALDSFVGTPTFFALQVKIAQVLSNFLRPPSPSSFFALQAMLVRYGPEEGTGGGGRRMQA